MAELQKAFFGVLHCATSNSLTGTLLRIEGVLLDKVLQELLVSASSHAEPSIRRGCFQVGLRFSGLPCAWVMHSRHHARPFLTPDRAVGSGR